MVTEKAAGLIDLSDFFRKLFAAETEAEVSDLFDETPEIFQEKLWALLDQTPPLNQVQDLRLQIKQWSKEIVLQLAHKNVESSVSFSDWIAGIPLLPIHVVKPLQDNYRSCSMIYENFSDCYDGFDKKSFYDNALEEIERWINLL